MKISTSFKSFAMAFASGMLIGGAEPSMHFPKWVYYIGLGLCFAHGQLGNKEAYLWKRFSQALNREKIDQDEVIKAHNALVEEGLWEDSEEKK